MVIELESESTYLIQLPTKNVKFLSLDSQETLKLKKLIDAWPKPFQGIKAKRLTVSGQRKVAAILSENNRKIRLLETEVEPDDEDEDEDDEVGDDSMMDTTSSTAASH